MIASGAKSPPMTSRPILILLFLIKRDQAVAFFSIASLPL
jgi:hypothetical protein